MRPLGRDSNSTSSTSIDGHVTISVRVGHPFHGCRCPRSALLPRRQRQAIFSGQRGFARARQFGAASRYSFVLEARMSVRCRTEVAPARISAVRTAAMSRPTRPPCPAAIGRVPFAPWRNPYLTPGLTFSCQRRALGRRATTGVASTYPDGLSTTTWETLATDRPEPSMKLLNRAPELKD